MWIARMCSAASARAAWTAAPAFGFGAGRVAGAMHDTTGDTTAGECDREQQRLDRWAPAEHVRDEHEKHNDQHRAGQDEDATQPLPG